MKSRPDRSRLQRRTLLATGLAGLLAGCSGGGDGDGDTPTRTETPTETRKNPRETTTQQPTPTEAPGTTKEGRLGEALTVRGAVVETREAFPTLHSFPVDATEVGTDVLTAPAGRQFGFVGLGVSGEGRPEAESYGLEVDGERSGSVAAAADAHRLYTPLPAEYAYQQEQEEGFLAFEMPAPLPPDADVTLVLDHMGSTGRWTVPDSLLADARAPPPAFELAGIEAPDTVAPGTQFDVDVTLRNAGEGTATAWVAVRELPDGTVRGGVTQGIELAPGQTATVTSTLSSLLGDDDVSRVDVVVRTSGGNGEATVRVESA